MDTGYFNPRSPCGERRCCAPGLPGTRYFNPRSPCGERLRTMNRKEEMPLFQSTLPMRGATEDAAYMIPKGAISIHAPHAGSDNEVNENVKLDTNFNPRSPCGERPVTGNSKQDNKQFQSTLPMRGATVCVCMTPITGYFNPRSPCGERLSLIAPIAIYLPFQSTLPMRGATVLIDNVLSINLISIHAPHAGSDA